MMTSLEKLSDIAAKAAAMAAGGTPGAIEEKDIQDYVTDMDKRIELELREALSPMFGGVTVIGEESIGEFDCLPDRVIIVDPIDGTSNWIAGIPFASVSIAYIENGGTVLAAIASIGADKTYVAEAGKGAWSNGEKLHLAGSSPMPLVGLSTGLLDAIDDPECYRSVRRVGKLRNLGSQALQLCAVAQGSLAMNASFEARLWDDAAGRLIATEAGARYRTFAREAADAIRPASAQKSLCAHPGVFAEMEAVLRPILE